MQHIVMAGYLSSREDLNDPGYFNKVKNEKPDPSAKPNLNPIIDGKLTFVKEIKNARLYVAGEGDDKIDVVHLWGSPYEMGFAHGTIQKDRAIKLINTIWTYLEMQIVEDFDLRTKINWVLKAILNIDRGNQWNYERNYSRRFPQTRFRCWVF